MVGNRRVDLQNLGLFLITTITFLPPSPPRKPNLPKPKLRPTPLPYNPFLGLDTLNDHLNRGSHIQLRNQAESKLSRDQAERTLVLSHERQPSGEPLPPPPAHHNPNAVAERFPALSPTEATEDRRYSPFKGNPPLRPSQALNSRRRFEFRSQANPTTPMHSKIRAPQAAVAQVRNTSPIISVAISNVNGGQVRGMHALHCQTALAAAENTQFNSMRLEQVNDSYPPPETIPSPLTPGICGGGSEVDADVVSDERGRVDVGVDESEDEDEELPIDDVVEKYADVGVTRDGVEATVVSVCVWIVGLIPGSWVGECGATTGGTVVGLKRRLWTGTPAADTFLAPKGLGLLLLKLNGLAKPLLREAGASTDTCSSACESSMDARMDAAESRTDGTDCSSCSVDFARDTRWGLGGWWGSVGGEGITGGSISRSKIADEDERLWLSCQIGKGTCEPRLEVIWRKSTAGGEWARRVAVELISGGMRNKEEEDLRERDSGDDAMMVDDGWMFVVVVDMEDVLCSFHAISYLPGTQLAIDSSIYRQSRRRDIIYQTQQTSTSFLAQLVERVTSNDEPAPSTGYLGLSFNLLEGTSHPTRESLRITAVVPSCMWRPTLRISLSLTLSQAFPPATALSRSSAHHYIGGHAIHTVTTSGKLVVRIGSSYLRRVFV
ncbi:uncharacterized protein LACBIDRAFT_327480 [Laccaria bicolor S238N-H82]|uniref:Predicted protein n=1 Tax=Laccaria bicolor (strain S238N-H82 / ATCC MYA-4686) TaxID=486041 RepID=B0DBU9_LACBS|nr:uncharacterized protein LACBIDRAFT_327480 [Laccaria bicolor S238N-H82]EDR07626.1 predicted protein [Laccaria bicolor S238N-H82]|eukprot:XP_001881415.1 predicted protein [Laccaria bicolor S238N-H82]